MSCSRRTYFVIMAVRNSGRFLSGGVSWLHFREEKDLRKSAWKMTSLGAERPLEGVCRNTVRNEG